jgi:hypothetical protein
MKSRTSPGERHTCYCHHQQLTVSMHVSASTNVGSPYTYILHQVQECLTQSSHVPNTTPPQTPNRIDSSTCVQAASFFGRAAQNQTPTCAITNLNSIFLTGVRLILVFCSHRDASQCSGTEGSECLVQGHWWEDAKMRTCWAKRQAHFNSSSCQSTNLCPLTLCQPHVCLIV